jgi:hypothetical protein
MNEINRNNRLRQSEEAKMKRKEDNKERRELRKQS